MPAFRTLTHAPFHRAIADSLGYSNPRIVQSQLIAKSAGKGSAIVPHQDGCVSFTNPPSCLTFWYALENATLENGCLSVAKGSHLTEPLKQRLVEGAKGVPKFKALENPVWAREASPAETTGGEKELQYEPLEVKAGTLVLAHGNLMHKSAGNRSNKSRLAYTFSIVEGDLGFPNDNYMKSSVDSDIL